MKNMNSICTFQMDVSFSDFSVSGGFCKAFISQVWDLPPEIPQAIPLCDAMVADRYDRFSFLRSSQSAQLQWSLWDV